MERYEKYKDSGIEWIGEIPEGWKVIALKRLVNKITDGEHISPKFTQSGMPFLSAKDVRDGYVQIPDDKFVDYEDGLRFRRRCDPELNDILIVSRGATVGRVAVLDTNVEFCLLGSVILLKPTSEILSLYLFYSLKNKLVQDYFLHSSQSSAQQAIYLEKVATVYLAIPMIEEQAVIVGFIKTETARIDAKIAKTKRIIELQKEYRTALISEVVTGKIKVTEESTL
jgi:type I restriction enzyme S subunit